MIPPKQNAEFVAHMEETLDLYCLPYDPKIPLVCMDEQPTQLIAETQESLAPEPGKPERYDYEYERKGTAANFMFTEPLGKRRKVSVRKRRTAVDWADEIKKLVDEDYPHAEKIRLVVDNLNTHKTASLYEAFEPAEAHRLARRLEIHYTPKHGSWLNIAEIELSVLTNQCLNNRYISNIETLAKETKAWEKNRNETQKGVDWQFTTEGARIKLKHLYPKFQT